MAASKPELQEVLRAISQGEISRIEAGNRLGIDLPFGDMLMLLREHGLPLPRFRVNHDSPGMRLLRQLLAQGRNVSK